MSDDRTLIEKLDALRRDPGASKGERHNALVAMARRGQPPKLRPAHYRPRKTTYSTRPRAYWPSCGHDVGVRTSEKFFEYDDRRSRLVKVTASNGWVQARIECLQDGAVGDPIPGVRDAHLLPERRHKQYPSRWR